MQALSDDELALRCLPAHLVRAEDWQVIAALC
jgi:hypothetical protein